MTRHLSLPLAAAAAAAAAASLLPLPAQAAEIIFSGGMTGSAITGSDASCAPIPFRGTITGGVGTSPLGSFSYNHNVCTSGPIGGPIVGTFTIDFGVDQFFGSLTGVTGASGTPNIFDLLLNYSITGGTGRFAGASGAFTGIGTANTATRPSVVSLNFSAVPEPGTWGLLLLGFGAVGMSLRRRPTVAPPQLA